MRDPEDAPTDQSTPSGAHAPEARRPDAFAPAPTGHATSAADGDVEHLARGLAAHGIGAGDVVAVIADGDAPLARLLRPAVARCGATPLLIAPSMPADRAAALLAARAPRLAIAVGADAALLARQCSACSGRTVVAATDALHDELAWGEVVLAGGS